MTPREKQQRLDALALKYLDALDTDDFDAIDAFWQAAESDAELEAMLHDLHAEIVAEQNTAIDAVVLEQIKTHLPSADVMQPASKPVTVAEVADFLRRHPPAGLTIEELRLNDELRSSPEVVPTQLGISQVVDWGAQFGSAPAAYWKAFRQVALDLWMQRSSAADYQMAARSQRPKRPEDKK